ncbi:MAG: extracellular solute-binding protein, partial [Lachnospiraceae bacterium]|nr:extracellular solute-binding protein [Lachnospiraceae bacterium]
SNESMMACRDNILMCVTAKTLFLYDLEEKCFIEDAVLESFVEENYKGGMLWVGGTYHVYPFLGADRTIYFVGEKGLYRHAIGGGVVEQVIDGAFSPLGSPTEHIVAMIANDNNEFLGMFDNGKLFQYVYDADLPSVPTDRLTVYSLNEDELVKQTIAVCQAEAPNLYIQYQIGMDEEGITREDAIKKLNTQLLAGGGPDIIILDNMNIDAYAEKGVLKDLSDIVAEVGEQEGLYGSIVENLAMDGRIYTVPGKFYIPVIYGQEAFVNGVEDYVSMAKMVAGARKAFPDTDLLNVCSATGILRRSMPVCAPSWTDADGKLNRDNIRLFLEQSRQIYDAQINGTPQAEIEAYEQSRYLQDGTDIEERADFGSIYSSDYLLLQAPFAYGEITAAWDYEDMLSVPKMRDAKGMVSKQLNGQSSNVYHPASMIGINVAAEHSEAADQFVKRMLGADVQKLIQIGLPVSQKALWEQFACEESALGEDGEKAYSGFTLANGENFIYSVYPASQADIERLDAWIAQLDTPYLGDMVLENAVRTEGAAYLEGRQTLDAAVTAIVDSVEIYLYE